ncbi:bis(5'-nucleosyl)-tetraphosphatase (symmetrical) YqeK [Calothrix sp. 336/3]|uniref:bis(5'-nucleosyl)-tetraphosphatase (symmetrical) YqeK n=1 Tax=Calothrix sp. 336/3 TaxID=1337936 RepID=UPI0004E406BC|nr:bis(5'-nucleosyl)-tetraphosphatase (symmetrical) YqeK [Calothrix sp. 336/3]AKG24093.1 phosphohydrolase [Calothrix sp. 336/3]
MRQQVLAWLRENVPDSRVNHILRVEELARNLAVHHGVDSEKAALAGLMHDLAKFFKPRKLLAMASRGGVEIDAVMSTTPHLLHADVSAIVARETFGVKDTDVLEAIANHTLGRPAMNPLSCIVFLADALEPGRGDSEQLQTLRNVSQENIHRGVWLTCDYTLKYLLDSPYLIHPRAIATRNWFLNESKNKPAI